MGRGIAGEVTEIAINYMTKSTVIASSSRNLSHRQGSGGNRIVLVGIRSMLARQEGVLRLSYPSFGQQMLYHYGVTE